MPRFLSSEQFHFSRIEGASGGIATLDPWTPADRVNWMFSQVPRQADAVTVKNKTSGWLIDNG